jgi:DinB family protein
MTNILKQLTLCLTLAMAAGPFCPWPGEPPIHDDAPAAALQALISNTETLVTGAAREMPDDKYTFAPTAGEFRGVRTFAKQLKHAAAVQYLVAFSILGEPVTADMVSEQGPDSIRTKADVVRYVEDSFAALRRAAGTVDSTNAFAPVKGVFGSAPATRVGLIAGALAHSSNHYGQVVEYLRMNGIVPPESR